MKAPPVQKLLSIMGSGGLLTGPPEVHVLPIATSFQRSSVKTPTADTVVTLLTMGYKPGTTTKALEGWKALVEYCEANESDTLAYAVLEDKENNVVRTAEVYASNSYVAEVHVKGPGLKINQEQNGADRNGEKSVVRAKILYGYLGK
jgi:quinol monooxygenase YgiN